MPRVTRSSALASSSKQPPHEAQIEDPEQLNGIHGAGAETSNAGDALSNFEVRHK